jgi:hypothetical protein
LAILAKGFVDENSTPPPELRPRFDREIPMEELVGNQPVKKTPLERLANVKDATDLFIFSSTMMGMIPMGALASTQDPPPQAV